MTEKSARPRRRDVPLAGPSNGYPESGRFSVILEDLLGGVKDSEANTDTIRETVLAPWPDEKLRRRPGSSGLFWAGSSPAGWDLSLAGR